MDQVKSLIKNIFAYTILLLAIGLLVFSIYAQISSQDLQVKVFGYQSFIVRSNSMAATDFKAGDLIVVKTVDPKDLKVGDIIAFKSSNDLNYNEVVSHKIRKINKNKDNLTFTTYGSSTNTDDKNDVFANNIIGRYVFKICKLGYVIAFIKNPNTLILLLFTFLISVITYFSIKVYRTLKVSKI